MQPARNFCNHLLPSWTTQKTIQNHQQPATANPQPPTVTQKITKKAKTCHKQLRYCILNVNNETFVHSDSEIEQYYLYLCVCLCETDVDFDCEMKQYYIYTLAYVCVHISHIFWLDWLFIFVRIQSNSCHVQIDGFCLLKIWTYELLPTNIKQF